MPIGADGQYYQDIIKWRAQPKQDEFLRRTEDEVLYGGAAGGGKSDALIAFGILRATKYPRTKHLLLRRTFTDLEKAGGTLDRSHELLDGVARFDGAWWKWHFPNESILEFGYMSHEDDKYHFQCFSSDTEILTEGGWKLVSDVAVGEQVATMNPETRYMEYLPTTAIRAYPYSGDMIAPAPGRDVSFMVTPNHTIWASTQRVPKLRPYRADQLPRVARIPQWANCGEVRSGPEIAFSSDGVCKHTIRIPYDGTVHCVTVPPYHTLLIRHNGRVSWSGNTAQYDSVIFDELTHFSESQYMYLTARCRATQDGVPSRVRAACNPGGIGHCVPSGEVLTDTGWKSIKDVEIGDMVLTQDDNDVLVHVPVEQKFVEYFDGELYVSNSAAARFECTPNHKIARVTLTKNQLGRTYHPISLIAVKDMPSVVQLPEIGVWGGEEIIQFSLDYCEPRKSRLTQPFLVDGNDYCEFMGWFLSEGYTVDRDKSFGISQSKEENRERIAYLLDRMGFSYRTSKSGFLVYSVSWHIHLKQFGKCRDKFVPNNIKNAPTDQLALFLEALLAGDGHGSHYYTASKQLADDVCEIGLKLGHRVYLSERQRDSREGLSYDVNLKLNRKGWVDRESVVKVPYSGNVYCIGVRYHRFFLRQNGTVWLSGNSWVKRRFIDPAPPNTVFKIPPPSTLSKGNKASPKHLDENAGAAEIVMLADLGEQLGERSAIFVPARLQDNKVLMDRDPKYWPRLMALPENEMRALAYGDWDIFAGQVFNEWRRHLHVIKPFEIPSDWPRWIGYDFGRREPACALWVARDPDGNIYVYREMYVKYMTDTQQGKLIRQMSAGERIVAALGDPSCFHRQPNGGTIADNLNIGLIPANNNRLAGWQKVHNFLYWSEEQPEPRLKVFEDCVNLIRTLPAVSHDKHVNHLEDVDTKTEDHAPDALRYVLMGASQRRVQGKGKYALGKARAQSKAVAWDPFEGMRLEVGA